MLCHVVVRRGLLCAVCVFLTVCGILAAACAAGEAGQAGTLDLPGGGFIEGQLVPAPAPAAGTRSTLLWRSPAFTAPLEFHLDEIVGIRFPRPAVRKGAGAWRIMLHGGDVLTGDLEAIDGASVTVSVGGGDRRQRVKIDRAAIERLASIDRGAAAGYVGPGGLAGWEQLPANTWTQAAGSIGSVIRGAKVSRDVGGPMRAVYDMVLKWRQQPACRVAVAAGAEGEPDPYQFELFSIAEDGHPEMLLVREEKDRAVSEPLPGDDGAADRPRRRRVVLFVDQERGRLAIVLPETSPEPVADITLPPAAGRRPSGRFRLTSGGDIELASLRVTEWTGELPALERRKQPVVVRRDATQVIGNIASLAAGATELLVSGASGDTPVPLADVREILLPGAAPAERPPVIRAQCADGMTLGGELVRIDDGNLWLRREGIDEPVGLPRGSVALLESGQRMAEPRPLPGRVGRLRAAGCDARGAIVAAADGVGWQPVGGLAGSGLATGPGTGTVLDYVERPAPGQDAGADEVGGLGAQVNEDGQGFFVIVMMRDDGAAAIDGRIQPGDRIVAVAPEKGSRFVETKGIELETVMNLLRGRIGTPVRLKVTANDGTDPREVQLVRRTIHVFDPEVLQAALADHARLAPGGVQMAAAGDDFPALAFLRSGDVLPCAVAAIDADGIAIRTPLAEASRREAVRVPAALVQAVELKPTAASRGIDRARLDRLLTLPRLQRANPPTHLLRLDDGDYLRGRVVALDAKVITFAMADAVKEIPRDVVARVIWLHPEDVDGAAVRQLGADGGLLVQGVARDGRRVTVVAESVAGTTIRGRSFAIGAAEIDTGRVDRLLIGDAIEAEAESLPYRQWKLKPAPEPRALRKPAEG
jgi:hypothetical protein